MTGDQPQPPIRIRRDRFAPGLTEPRYVLIHWPELDQVAGRFYYRSTAAAEARRLLREHGRDTFLAELVDERAGRCSHIARPESITQEVTDQ